jgi:hypothetical protein
MVSLVFGALSATLAFEMHGHASVPRPSLSLKGCMYSCHLSASRRFASRSVDENRGYVWSGASFLQATEV